MPAGEFCEKRADDFPDGSDIHPLFQARKSSFRVNVADRSDIYGEIAVFFGHEEPLAVAESVLHACVVGFYGLFRLKVRIADFPYGLGQFFPYNRFQQIVYAVVFERLYGIFIVPGGENYRTFCRIFVEIPVFRLLLRVSSLCFGIMV